MEAREQREGVGLHEILGVLRRRVWIIAASVVLAMGVARVISFIEEPRYEASAIVDVGIRSSEELLREGPPQAALTDREIQTRAELLSAPRVARSAARTLDTPAAQKALSAVKVAAAGTGESTEDKSNVVTVTASSPEPEAAAAAANAYTRAAINSLRAGERARINAARQSLQAQVKRLSRGKETGSVSRRIDRLERRAEDLRVLAALEAGGVELVESASVPTVDASPSPLRTTLIGGFAGLLLGLALAVLAEQLDRRLKRSRDVETALDLPLLATVPESPALSHNGRPLPAPAPAEPEAFQMLRANLRYGSRGEQVASVLVISAGAAEGKTTVALNLAAAAATTGTSVLLIEADLRRPRLAKLFSILPEGPPSLRGTSDPSDLCDRVPVGPQTAGGQRPTLDVVPAGRLGSSPTVVFESSEIGEMLRAAEQKYDFVVVDGPPMTVADSIPLMRMVGGVIVVASLRSITTDIADRMLEQLARVGATPVGVVANFASPDDARDSCGYTPAGPQPAPR